VKCILNQLDIDKTRRKCIARILEFDLEIKPTKLVKCQGLAKLLAKSNCKSLEVNFINTFSENQQADQNLDQGSKICSIFKVLGMRRKWCHCIRLVLLIPAVYLFSQTESVWRSYRGLFAEPNRQNFDADWQAVQLTWQAVRLMWRPYSDVACPYRTRGSFWA
jgi:hypothetical protein